ncbi:MAG: sigma 54-interacting transcriptional regulator [Ruminococcus flavefaciens]|nr:sigma 54-interacting transcriptional regulator [Ruminococcus flavefaciens]
MNHTKCTNCFTCSSWQKGIDECKKLNREELIQQVICMRNLNASFQTWIESLPDTFFVTDGDGNILLVNQAYERLSNLSRKEIIGRNMRDYVGDIISASSTLMVMQTGKEITLEQTHYSSGRKSYVTSKPIIENGELRFIISSNRDFVEISSLQKQLEQERCQSEKYYQELQHMRKALFDDPQIIAKDEKTLSVLKRAKKAATANVGVLLIGETGTGKTEFAKFIHRNSERKDRPFFTIDCGAIVPSLIESELFGYEKGAFTGAKAEGRKGMLELGNRGTIFLDEIGELPLELQVKLLHVLQEQEFYRIGGSKPVKVDIRFISATNCDLQAMISAKTFREDLYYRLGSVVIQIPPIRERPADIIPLSAHFLDVFNKRHKADKKLTPKAYQLLKRYSWPGNVRELKNTLEEAVIMSDAPILDVQDLSISSPSSMQSIDAYRHPKLDSAFDIETFLETIEFNIYQDAYQRAGSIRKAAKLLGVSASTYARKLKVLSEKYGKSGPMPEEI